MSQPQRSALPSFRGLSRVTKGPVCQPTPALVGSHQGRGEAGMRLSPSEELAWPSDRAVVAASAPEEVGEVGAGGCPQGDDQGTPTFLLLTRLVPPPQVYIWKPNAPRGRVAVGGTCGG